jgi:hypothetical protein
MCIKSIFPAWSVEVAEVFDTPFAFVPVDPDPYIRNAVITKSIASVAIDEKTTVRVVA